MPTVPSPSGLNQSPNPGPQPSPTDLLMAAASMPQRVEPSNEGLSQEVLDEHVGKTMRGISKLANPERFNEVLKRFPESKNIDDRRWEVLKQHNEPLKRLEKAGK